MPRSAGTYSAPASSWNPAVNAASAALADWNALLADISNALTQSQSLDGQSTPTANLPMGGFKFTGLGAGTATGNSARWEQLFDQGTEASLASAATTDIGAQNTNFLQITGTTAITSVWANYKGPRFLRFSGALTLTYNASTLILPGAADILTAAGDSCVVTPISGGWVVSQYQRAVSASALVSGTSVNASGTSIDFTGIPSWVKSIDILFNGVSPDALAAPLIQIGDSGGIEVAGYVSSGSAIAGAISTTSSTAGFVCSTLAAVDTISGVISLRLLDAATFTWVCTGGLSTPTPATLQIAGSKALSATLDRVRITTVAGTASFDAGSVNVLYS